eukprot:130668-Prymnesium_polylepis.1
MNSAHGEPVESCERTGYRQHDAARRQPARSARGSTVCADARPLVRRSRKGSAGRSVSSIGSPSAAESVWSPRATASSCEMVSSASFR